MQKRLMLLFVAAVLFSGCGGKAYVGTLSPDYKTGYFDKSAAAQRTVLVYLPMLRFLRLMWAVCRSG